MLQNVSRFEPSPRERVQRVGVLLRRSKAYWRGALAVVCVVSLACIAAIWRLPHIYMSEALILAQPAIRTDTRTEEPTIDAARIGPKLKDRLLSRSRLARIIEALRLFPDTVEKRGMQDAVEEMRLHIGFRARDSDTFLVSFEAESPSLAQAVAERLAESLVEDFVTEGVRRAVASRDFLVEEEHRAADELDRRGRELSAFIAQHPQFAFDPNRPQGVPNDGARLPMLGPGAASQPPSSPAMIPGSRSRAAAPMSNDPDLVALQRQRSQIEAQLAFLLTPGNGRGGGSGGADSRPPTLQQERERVSKELAQAQADVADKRRRFTDEHPDLISARNHAVELSRALSAIEQKLAQAGAARADDGADRNAVELQRRLAELKSAISARERSLGVGVPRTTTDLSTEGVSPRGPPGSPAFRIDSFVTQEAEWQRLVQAAAEARRAKDDVSDRRARSELLASAAQSSGSMVMTIVDQAFLPLRPVKPNRRLIAIVCVSCAILLGVLWGLAGVLLSDTVHDGMDLEASGASPVLALLPRPGKNGKSHDHLPASLATRLHATRPRGAPRNDDGGRPSDSSVIVTDPAYHGDPVSRSLPPGLARYSRTSAAKDNDWAKDADGQDAMRGVSAHPICDVEDGRVISARTALSSWKGRALGHPVDAFSALEQPFRSGRVRHRDWTRDLEDVAPSGSLDGAFEPWEIPLAGEPQLALRAAALVSSNALSALRLLRHWVEQHAHDGGMVVGITSAIRGEGKTNLAVQLAWMLAESERATVLLMEANFERPRIEELLGISIPRGYGFSAQIQRRILRGRRVGWGVVSIDSALHVLVESAADARFPAALHSREFAQAIEELRRRYDYVVIDGPSIIDGGNATSVESAADGLLMVVRAGLSKGSVIKRAGRALGTRRLLGFVLTDVEEHAT